ncbi:MAG: alpha/beta hydrolase [Anaerolineaceae bacterium]|nr:alpha/beta hydrolase [Anaerolineaceae bacterium]
MPPSNVERGARASLPVIQFMQTHMPLPFANRMMSKSAARVRLGADVKHTSVLANGVAAHWIVPQTGATEQVLLYFHGGGFVFGLSSLHLQMAASLAKRSGLRVLMVDYRLAPDAPFPAALEDCLSAYQWLLAQGVQAHNIVLGGDSAGGNLVLTLLLQLRGANLPLPAAAACLSPVTDLTEDKQLDPTIHDPVLSVEIMHFYNQAYLAGNDPHDPLISPVYGDLHGFPPLLIHVGEDEMLRGDAKRIAAVAEAAGVEVRLEVYARMWHVWQLTLSLPQATQSLDDIAQFFKAHLNSVSD